MPPDELAGGDDDGSFESESLAEAARGSNGEHRRSKHPLAVALPIGAWGASLAFDLLSLYGPNDNPYARLSRNAMLVGLAGASASGALGLRDLIRFSPEREAPPALGFFHAALNLGAVTFYILATLRRSAVATEGELDGDEASVVSDRAGRVSGGDVVSNALALVVLAGSGAAGGLLARRFDVRPG